MYKLMTAVFILSCFVGVAQPQPAAQSDSLNEHLQAFKPFLNKTWKGTFVEEPGQPASIDISHWERILNGQAIRMTHSVNQGVYGGETILF